MAGLLLVGGCTARPGDTAADDSSLAYADFLRVRTAAEELERLEYEPVLDCLRGAGFEFETPAPPPIQVPDTLAETPRSLSVEQAAVMGYGEFLPSSVDSVWDAIGRQLPDAAHGAYVDALLGADTSTIRRSVNGIEYEVGAQGCFAEARERLYGSLDDFLFASFYTSAAQATVVGVSEDRRVIDAIGRWSSCMQVAGWDFATPLDAFDDATVGSSRSANATPTPREISIAVSDAQCREEAELETVYNTAAEGLVKGWVAEHQVEVAAARDRIDGILQHATLSISLPTMGGADAVRNDGT